MNLFRMDKEEYRKFRIFINIMVFIAFLAVFFFVELSSIKSKSIIQIGLFFMIIEFIYGKELVSREGKFISLTALTADSSKKRQR